MIYSHERIIAYGFLRKCDDRRESVTHMNNTVFYNHKLNLTSNFSLSIKDRLVYIFLYVPGKKIQST